MTYVELRTLSSDDVTALLGLLLAAALIVAWLSALPPRTP